MVVICSVVFCKIECLANPTNHVYHIQNYEALSEVIPSIRIDVEGPPTIFDDGYARQMNMFNTKYTFRSPFDYHIYWTGYYFL